MQSLDFPAEWPEALKETVLQHRLARLDMWIKIELDLIVSRTGWLLTSQAFLLAAYATTVFSTSNASMKQVLLVLLPLVGAFFCLGISRSIAAAMDMIQQHRTAREPLMNRISRNYGFEIINSTPQSILLGDIPPKIFPIVLLLVWLTLGVSPYLAKA